MPISNVHSIIAVNREYEGKNNDQRHVSESRTRLVFFLIGINEYLMSSEYLDQTVYTGNRNC